MGRVLDDPNRYLCFEACLLGKESFKVTPLEGLDLQERLNRSQNHDLAVREFIWNSRYQGPTDDDVD
jgi:hypothetical protein